MKTTNLIQPPHFIKEQVTVQNDSSLPGGPAPRAAMCALRPAWPVAGLPLPELPSGPSRISCQRALFVTGFSCYSIAFIPPCHFEGSSEENMPDSSSHLPFRAQVTPSSPSPSGQALPAPEARRHWKVCLLCRYSAGCAAWVPFLAHPGPGELRVTDEEGENIDTMKAGAQLSKGRW